MSPPTETVLLAVNGTLMRGLELNPNLLEVGATFVRETKTESAYRPGSVSIAGKAKIPRNSELPGQIISLHK